MTQRDAGYYVTIGRAVWVGTDQLRLVPSHRANQAAFAVAIMRQSLAP